MQKPLTRLDGCQHWCDTCEFRIEITSISRTGYLRKEWWLYPLVVYIIPIDISKKWLAHDFLRISWSTPKTLIWFSGEEFLQYRNRVARHMDGVQWFIGQNSIINFVFILASEGRLLQKHLVYENTECPPIYSTAILLVQQDLAMSAMSHEFVNTWSLPQGP